MGGSNYETYVEYLNEKIKLAGRIEIEVKQVDSPLTPKNKDNKSFLLEKKPMIFHGKPSETHFTCTTGDGILIDPYVIGIQMNNTDHFCQTFSLMYMEHHYFHESEIGKLYQKIKLPSDEGDKRYLNNVMLAIKAACYVIEVTNENFEIDDYVKTALFSTERGRGGQELRHAIYSPIPKDVVEDEDEDEVQKKLLKYIVYKLKLVEKLLKYCKQLTKQQVFESSFIEKIFRLADKNQARGFRKSNRGILED